MLLTLILIPILSGVLAWLTGKNNPLLARLIALAAMSIELVILLCIWKQSTEGALGSGKWLIESQAEWVPQLGISFHLALDGLSLSMLLLTAFIGIAAVLCSWTEIEERVGFFHFNLLWVLGGIVGVFLAMDLFMFYFFWEMMLIPMYFLIAIWGYERRVYAAVKFFIFTQLSGLLMLLSILSVYWAHHKATGVFTFDYTQLLNTHMEGPTAYWVMLGFVAAFAVKLPAFPVHSWLPDAHTEAPTAGSVVLAGLLLKTGAYGLMRFVLPMFPGAVAEFAPIAMTLGVIGIIYGAILAFAQTDLKRLVAYTSVSHMGFVLLAIFANNALALNGALMQMIAHGLATGALFILVGGLKERLHTRDIREMGGLWTAMPRMGAVALIFAVASLGMPGLGSFVAEFLILLGSFRVDRTLTSIASFGLIFASIYSLWIILRAFYGKLERKGAIPDLGIREMTILMAMFLGLLWLGVYPQPVFNMVKPTFDSMKPAAIVQPAHAEAPKSAAGLYLTDSQENS